MAKSPNNSPNNSFNSNARAPVVKNSKYGDEEEFDSEEDVLVGEGGCCTLKTVIPAILAALGVVAIFFWFNEELVNTAKERVTEYGKGPIEQPNGNNTEPVGPSRMKILAGLGGTLFVFAAAASAFVGAGRFGQ